jgi:hypothetical protein
MKEQSHYTPLSPFAKISDVRFSCPQNTRAVPVRPVVDRMVVAAAAEAHLVGAGRDVCFLAGGDGFAARPSFLTIRR